MKFGMAEHDDLLKAAYKLSCEGQHKLAGAIAANVGYA